MNKNTSVLEEFIAWGRKSCSDDGCYGPDTAMINKAHQDRRAGEFLDEVLGHESGTLLLVTESRLKELIVEGVNTKLKILCVYKLGDWVRVRVWSDYCKRYDYYEGIVDSLNYFENGVTAGVACHPVGYPDQPTHYFYDSKLEDGITITKDIIKLEKLDE